ncbi:hypothetical protein [Arenibaculum pallidiluteum]|uniref:hypothetical protein n=1 Tax=Arenibaculum pallidiluteum TaxID=2812559 RepID=UPI001A97821A|nr:hypothetical protein [Arenibaculum pallidiluteum]
MAAFAAALALQGCAGTPAAPSTEQIAQGSLVSLVADADSNGGQPLAIDVVRVADVGLDARLSEMDAARWFRAREQLLRDNPGLLAVTSWEVVAGQRISLRSLPPFEGTPVSVVVFALYQTPGTHRLRLSPEDPVHLALGARDFRTTAGQAR